LLNGRPATTHWGLAGLFADLYPEVRVDAAALYVDDGDVLTSGGGAAGMDLGLHLIRWLCGADVATKLAKGVVLPPYQRNRQAPYIELPIPPVDEKDPVAETVAWVLTKLDKTLSVDELAKRAHMSRRNYDRRFREITGAAPATWLTYQRVARAQYLLESTTLPIEQIARYCGFSSAAALRPHFRKLLGVAPATYRETFEMS
jgi:transcriptional regulator GlxA family with amidase domain